MDAEIKELFDWVLDRMVGQRWVYSHLFREGGYFITWTERGALAAVDLKKWYDLLAIKETDDRARIVHEFTSGIRQSRSTAKAVEATRNRLMDAGFIRSGRWTESGKRFRARLNNYVSELELAGDDDGLFAMFFIGSAWCPDPDTPIRWI